MVRTLLPLLRAAAGRDGRRPGTALLVAALIRVSSPRWVLLRPRPLGERLALNAEAVRLSRWAVGRERFNHAALLARSLVLRSGLLLDAERYDEALTTADESLAVPDLPTAARPTAYAELVRALCLASLGRLDEALTAADRAEAAYRTAPPRGTGRRPGSLVAALRARAWVLGRLGRTTDSVEAYRRCRAAFEEARFLEQTRLHALGARALGELTGALRALDRFGEAVETGGKALEQLTPLMLRVAPELAALRAALLVDLARCLDATGEPTRARATAEEAVTACRTLTGPGDGALLLLALDGLAGHLERAGEHTREQVLREEHLALCAQLVAGGSVGHEPVLVEALDSFTGHPADEDGETGARPGAATRSVLAPALARIAVRHLDAGRTDETVAALRRLWDLEGRTERPDAHAVCAVAFAEARRNEAVVRAWQRATDRPWPVFVYRKR
ncbi:hypothetical protein [Streptomyces sp. NPDC057682]|uniref:hypothetical protein n=1 Tax=Streptomyces sp. NPDC057682 TaxID=3346210 RepID=UPI0036C0E936